MNPEVKAQWIAALRSGEFHQGTGLLHKVMDGNHLFCCLGILCEVAEKNNVDVRVSSYQDDNDVITYDGYEDFLPPKIQQWAGLDSPNPGTQQPTDIGNVRATLSWLNDNGNTFSDIADIIEREF